MSSEQHPIRDVIVTGVGFAADAYDLFVIGVVLVVLDALYHDESSDYAVSVLSSVSLAAAVVGQLLFGYLASRYGRKKLFVLTSVLIIIGAITSGCVFNTSSVSIFVLLIVCRGVMGIGIGGEYPLAATIAKEKSNSNRKTVLVFAGQGIGILFAALLFLALVTVLSLDALWRVLVVAGAVPGLATLYYRVKMHETSEFQQLARVARPRITIDDLRNGAWKALLGTASTWFLFDITFYGNGVFAATILKSLLTGDLGTKLYYTAIFNLIIAVISLLGYFCAAYTIDSRRVDKRKQQIIGFVAVAIVFATLGALLPVINGNLYLFAPIYGLTFFFSNWGPNTSTFVLPTIVFGAKVRPLFHGISAAAGKLGAVVGAAMMKPLNDAYGTASVMYVSAAISIVGAVATLLLPRDIDAMNSQFTHQVLEEEEEQKDSGSFLKDMNY